MGGLEKRLARLEERAGKPLDDASIRQEVLSRRSDTELRSYVEALRRARDQGGFAPEDVPILERRERLYEEVRSEPAPAS